MTQRLREDGGAGRPAWAAGLGPRRVRGAAEPSGPGLSAASRPAVPALPRGGLLTSPCDFRGSAQPRLPEFLRRVLSVSRVCLPSRTFPRAGSLRLLPMSPGGLLSGLCVLRMCWGRHRLFSPLLRCSPDVFHGALGGSGCSLRGALCLPPSSVQWSLSSSSALLTPQTVQGALSPSPFSSHCPAPLAVTHMSPWNHSRALVSMATVAQDPHLSSFYSSGHPIHLRTWQLLPSASDG